jgi:hypothetical protein
LSFPEACFDVAQSLRVKDSMPTLPLRKRLLDRLVRGANSVRELGLALLMTAGVANCGGSGQTKGEGTGDGGADHQLAVEAPAPPPDAGSDAHPGPIIEAPAPAPDAGSDASGFPMIEAPTPAPDAG